jgi:hypothetical protein
MYCRKCGADVPEESAFCPDCGTAVPGPPTGKPGGWYYPGQEKGAAEPTPPSEPTKPSSPDEARRRVASGLYNYPGILDPTNPFIRPQRDKLGRTIPREYPPNFNRNAWCWLGFLFPALWCCYKGIYNAAWKYIWIGLIPMIGSPIGSIWCGLVGHKEYAEFIDNTPPALIQKSRATGMGCFWLYLIVQIIANIVLTIVAIIFLRHLMGALRNSIPSDLLLNM